MYGVSFVLERAGTPGPKGSVFDKVLGNEDLYRIPNAAAATLTPLTADGGEPANGAPGTPVAVTHPDPASWKLVTHTAATQVLRLRLTDVPGWHATIDGRSVTLRPFAGVMLQVDVPAGHHTVVLRYWPARFTAGIILAACRDGRSSGRSRRRRREAPTTSCRQFLDSRHESHSWANETDCLSVILDIDRSP